MKRNLTVAVLLLAVTGAGISWLSLRTLQVGSACLSSEGVKATTDGSLVACASGTWKPQN
jgi:hypothetical protein